MNEPRFFSKLCRISTGLALAAAMLVPQAAFAISSPSASANVSSGDAPHSINELSMIVTPTWNRLSRTYLDTVYAAFMRYPVSNNGPYGVNVAIGRLGTGFSLSAPPVPSSPVAFDNTGDPVLASNSSNTGFHGYRVYLAGRNWLSTSTDDQITIWTLDASVSTTWTQQTAIGYSSDSHNADKPAIAVSQYSGTQGYAYLVYIRNGGGDQASIQFSANLGNDVWTSPTALYTASNGEALQGPRVDVDPSTGNVYVSWLNWSANTINVMVYTNSTSTWSGVYSTAAGNTSQSEYLLTGNFGDVCTNCAYSPSFLMSAYNSNASALALVYHRRKTGGSGSEVLMRKFTPSGGFTSAVHVSGLDSSTHDAWQGAVACASDGSCVVSYYDHVSSDPSSTGYRIYDRRVNSDGTSIFGESDILIDNGQNDASGFISHRMEYHDVFWRNSNWYTAGVITTVTSPNQSDVWVTQQ